MQRLHGMKVVVLTWGGLNGTLEQEIDREFLRVTRTERYG